MTNNFFLSSVTSSESPLAHFDLCEKPLLLPSRNFKSSIKSSLQQLVIETWVEYSIATIVVLLRYYTRIRMVGLRRLDYDDYLMPVAWVSDSIIVTWRDMADK
jgi:hypothetical protein